MKRQSRIMVVELDGATWNVMDPLIRQGKLPHIRALIADGASGILRSDPPLLSPRLWVSIFSGKHSRKHGIEFFGNSSSMVKCKRIWEIFHERGLPVGVFGTFVTWPPSPVNGFMIPSLFALGPETHPADYQFLQELTLFQRKRSQSQLPASSPQVKKSLLYYAWRMKRAGVSLRSLGEAAASLFIDVVKRNPPDERFWKRATAHLKISTEIFLRLYQQYRPAFATYHIHLCDAISHRYWKYYEPQGFHDVEPRLVQRYGRVIPRAYEECDRMIGKIRESAPDATIVVVSDHGCGAMESTRTAFRLHVENFLDRFHLRDGVIPAHVGLMTFCYFSDKKRMEQTRGDLEKVRFGDSHETVFDIFTEESLLGVRLSQKHWGMMIAADRGVELGSFGSCQFSDLFLPHSMEVTGTHTEDGIVIMAGPGIRKNVQISGAGIFDITPTLLALADLPVAEDMDGTVLQQALDPRFLETTPVRSIKTYEGPLPSVTEDGAGDQATYDDIKGQLKSLGYL